MTPGMAAEGRGTIRWESIRRFARLPGMKEIA